MASGDYRIDGLLFDPSIMPFGIRPPGTPISLTYSFLTALPPEDAYIGTAFTPFTEAEKSSARAILDAASQAANIGFQEVPTDGYIRFGNVNLGPAGPLGVAVNLRDIIVNSGRVQVASGVPYGSEGWATLLHELGHVLGLKHPEAYASDDAPPFLPPAEAFSWYSIMSYKVFIAPASWGTYDILALQYLYGTKPLNAGDNVYTYTDQALRQSKVIHDTGGVNTLDLSAVTFGPFPFGSSYTIDLRPGTFSTVGGMGTIGIAFDTVIQNLVGTRSPDAITGNGANNRITGGAGNDALDGQAGIDTAVYTGARTNFTVTKGASGYTVTDNGGADGIDTLANIERLKFADTGLALDLGGSAGNTAEIIGAAFGKQYLTNKTYVGIGLNLFDAGMSLAQVAQLCITADPFNNLGHGTDNAAFVRTVWLNVVGSPIDAGNLATFTGMLGTNQISQADLLALAAQTQSNQTSINLVGLSNTGIEFI